MRGLKQLTKAQAEYTEVASFTDAWIETFNPEFDHIGYQVASFTDAWIETDAFKTAAQMVNVASFTDAWIETRFARFAHAHLVCRIFYRCVD